VAVSVRLDARVLDWLKSKGEGHLTRINDILLNLMDAEQRAIQSKGQSPELPPGCEGLLRHAPAIASLKKVQAVYPQLKLESVTRGLRIHPCSTAVPAVVGKNSL
jgi:hypothetical protein